MHLLLVPGEFRGEVVCHAHVALQNETVTTSRREHMSRPAERAHARLVAEPDSALQSLRAFDFVLMQQAGADPNLAGFVPRCLTLVTQTEFVALFRVQRDAPACAGDPPK